ERLRAGSEERLRAGSEERLRARSEERLRARSEGRADCKSDEYRSARDAEGGLTSAEDHAYASGAPGTEGLVGPCAVGGTYEPDQSRRRVANSDGQCGEGTELGIDETGQAKAIACGRRELDTAQRVGQFPGSEGGAAVPGGHWKR